METENYGLLDKIYGGTLPQLILQKLVTRLEVQKRLITQRHKKTRDESDVVLPMPRSISAMI